jgi:choline dehydrogenase
MSDPTFDYVIVGGGTAGCVLAHRLSESGTSSVCMLEAGPADRSPWIHIPIGYGKTMFHPVYNWGFHTEPEPEMAMRRIYWPRGRGLGGSSSINGLIFIRGQADDYDAWAAAGNPGWGWRDVLPYFRRSEHNTRGADDAHGADGPMWSSDIPAGHPLVEAILEGAAQCGVPRTADFNRGDQEGAGYYQLFTRRGWRCSSAVAYLRPARSRANLQVRVNAQATRVLFEGRRAVGVACRSGSGEVTVRARREVVLAAGALQSPQLLQLSGVGDPALLQSFGIPVVHALPGVGENLQDHLQLRSMYKVSRPVTTNDQLASAFGRLRMGAQWLFDRSGPMAIGINQAGLFTRALPESRTPDIQFHFATLSAELAGAAPHPWSGCTFSVCQLRPASRGHVRLKSPDPLAAPAMQPNYLSAELDRRCAVAGLRFARRLAGSPALRPWLVEEYRPGAGVDSDDDLLAFARQYGATIFHPAGTCKMGPAGDAGAVVDARLRVHGLAGLRVVDCSIMPTLVSGNTAAPVLMVAEKAADLIREDAAAA